MKKIIIEIDEEGDCSIDGKGFVGIECSKFLKEIEEAIGTTVTSTNKKEYNQRTKTVNRNQQRIGGD